MNVDNLSVELTNETVETFEQELHVNNVAWIQFDNGIMVPYFHRKQVAYCFTRILEVNLVGSYLLKLHPHIYFGCTYIESYYCTKKEADLMNNTITEEIDQLKADVFRQGDLIVTLSDASKFYEYLKICYNKLINVPTENKCGFVEVNKKFILPYVMCGNEPMVPEANTCTIVNSEKLYAGTAPKKLQGWDLAYLKFTFLLVKTHFDLFKNSSIDVVSLRSAKYLYSWETNDGWPKEYTYKLLLREGSEDVFTKQFYWTHPCEK